MQVEEEEEAKKGEEAQPEVNFLLARSLWPDFLDRRSLMQYSYLLQEEKKTKKTVTEKYWDWELANETKPIWVSAIICVHTTN